MSDHNLNLRHLVIGTAGHIDHGKSTLVTALTGINPDRLQEEKIRGITIDLGFARYSHGATELAFVDVPGHERFVRNMLAGASGIDCVLLVVAADESVMPQTREHFEICKLLEVQNGVVALTKSDRVDEETIELVRLETRELVMGSFLENAPIVSVSSRTGAGLDELQDALSNLSLAVSERSGDGTARLPIDRAFTVRGFGTVVTGTQVSGKFKKNDEISILPSNRRVKIRGIQVHGEDQNASSAGQRVALNLTGVDVADLKRGDILTDVDGLEVTRRIDGVVSLLPNLRGLKHGARVRFHQGTTEVMARIALGAEIENGAAGEDSDITPTFPTILESGRRAYARLHLERAVGVTRGDRFVLRAYSPPTTIAGGWVLDPRAPERRLRSVEGWLRCRKLGALEDHVSAVMVIARDGNRDGIPFRDVTSRLGLSPEQSSSVAETLIASSQAVLINDRVVTIEVLEKASRTLIEMLKSFHQNNPLELGLKREEARGRLRHCASSDVFDYAVAKLVKAETVVAATYLALTSHRILLSTDERRVHDKIKLSYEEGGLTPPDSEGLRQAISCSDKLIDRMIRLLFQEGYIERVGSLIFHTETLSRLRAEVSNVDRKEGDEATIDVSTFKERFGVTRKYAIPLLEYLDQMRVTRRSGRGRIIL